MRIYLILFFNIFIYSQAQETQAQVLFNYDSTYEITEEINIESGNVVNEYDIGQCTCDLFPNYCDYRCCCDSECKEEDINSWKENNLCLDVDYNKLSNYSCFGRYGLRKKKKDSFAWNKLNSPLLYSDQIFKLICVRHDRTNKKIYEKYDESSSKLDDNYNFIIKNSYFNTLTDNNNNQDNQEKIKLTLETKDKKRLCIYKMSPYGTKLKRVSFIVSYPIEGYFILDECVSEEEEDISVELTDNDNVGQLKQLIIKIDPSNNDYKTKIILQLGSWNQMRKCHISIIWSSFDDSEERTNSIIKSGNPGYLIGKNVLFIINEDTIYNNGYFIYGADENGNCLDNSEEDNVVNIQSIKFKQNSIYSCTKYIEDCTDFENLLIFQSAQNFGGLKIGKYGDSEKNEIIDIISDKLPSENELYSSFPNKCNFPTKIYLEILVTKFLTKGQPQELIIGAKLRYSTDLIELNQYYKISFITKFVVFSEDLFENSDKQTSLYPITDDNILKP